MKKITIKLKDEETGAESEIECEIPDSTTEVFEAYLADLEVLLEVPALTMNAKYQMRWNEEGFSVKVEVPPRLEIATLLHCLRPFILSDEPASFDRVSGLVARECKGEAVRRFLGALRDRYAGRLLQEQIQVLSNDVLINSEKTLNLWLNSHGYHRDRDKTRELIARNARAASGGGILGHKREKAIWFRPTPGLCTGRLTSHPPVRGSSVG